MISGSIIASRDLGRHEDFDLIAYVVKDPYQMTERKNSVWTTVYFVAEKDGVTFGVHTVNDVLHHLTKPRKSALNRVQISYGILYAIRDARVFLQELTARSPHDTVIA